MDKKTFNLWNRIVAVVVFVIAAVTYLCTIEPTASFWDCGEFIASSYKLEVGHPPGNPVFQLFARIFTLPVPPEKAAVTVNAMNGILSALTIFFLYLTTVFFAKRLVKPGKEGYSVAQAIAIFGAGAVGALAYTFSDTFWFSAVEGVKAFVLKTVEEAGPNPCPPIIVGVGIGGTFDKAAYLAKKALMRPVNERNPDGWYAALEEELLESINALGVGPQGFGGRTTALAVNIEQYPTHIAGLPVAVNINCHVTRHKTCVI